jgi:hypothetical protein
MTRIKTTGKRSVMRNKVTQPSKIGKESRKRKQTPGLDKGKDVVVLRVLRRRPPPVPPPVLQSFAVSWRPHPNNAAGYVCFRLVVTATFSQPVDPARIGYQQYTRDRFSITAGTDPGNLQFTTTRFELDHYSVQDEEGDVSVDGILLFRDNPGYTLAFGLDGTTDLHYTFGAWWHVTLDGAVVLDTSARPLFGTTAGTHFRNTVPPGVRRATYDLALSVWNNAPPLTEQWPALPIAYPVPLVVDP